MPVVDADLIARAVAAWNEPGPRGDTAWSTALKALEKAIRSEGADQLDSMALTALRGEPGNRADDEARKRAGEWARRAEEIRGGGVLADSHVPWSTRRDVMLDVLRYAAMLARENAELRDALTDDVLREELVAEAEAKAVAS